MNHPWIAVVPLTAAPALREAVATLGPAVPREWPWYFHSGKSMTHTTPRGAIVSVCEQTVFGHLVLAVTDDREGLAARLASRVPVEDVAALARRSAAASSEAEQLDALLALASAQSLGGGAPLPSLEDAARRALDDESPRLRLAALRAIAVLPPPRALALLEGREDPANPELAGWREHYRTLVASER